jgi:hypothetical protein
MLDFYEHLSHEVQAALISAVVALLTMTLGTPLRYFINKRALRHKLSTEYEYEQRKRLRELVGRYHGRLIEAAERLNYRMWNLYANEPKGWLSVDGDFTRPEKHYYFASTVYRFLSVMALVRRFESEAIFIDSRIAEEEDLAFVKYLKALQWVCTDVALFEGLQYDSFRATDHFFSDSLRQVCDACWMDGDFFSIGEFQKRVKTSKSLRPVLDFFDGLNSSEQRFRWDRLVVFHLFLIAFINSFGYAMHRTSDDQLEQVVARINNAGIYNNAIKWIDKLGLGKDKKVSAVKKVLSSAKKF